MRLLLAIIVLFLSFQLGARDLLIKSNKRVFDVNITTSIEHWGIGESKTDLFLAYLSSNEYQSCRLAKTDSLAKVTELGYNGDRCIYYNLPLGRKKKLKKHVVLKNKFELETYDVEVDFDAIGVIPEYDTCSTEYQLYTRSDLPFIDLEHDELVKVSAQLWEDSHDIIDYARACYYYTARNFKYGVPESGFKSLNHIMKYKLGDCGNLCSVFITLLRMTGIPARHLMGFRPDGSLHVWADFYVQDKGWIPVDPTYENHYPTKDYFGKIKFEHNGFIVQRGIAQEIFCLPKRKRIAALQTYSYQVSYSKQHHSKVYIDRKVSCVEKNNSAQ